MHKAMFVQLALGLLIGGSLGAVLGYFGKCSSGTCPLTANPYRGAFIGSLMGGLLAFSGGSSRPRDEGNESGYAALQIANVADFERLALQAKLPVLVDFYSNSCPPCRQLAPTVEELAEEYAGRAVVCKINVERAPDLAQQYGIQGVPAVVFFKDGEEMQRLVRLQPRSSYTDVLDKLIG
ncbi:MAG: thioredoxin family protein [Phycisphaerales bacterium]|nr:MAG: thioredoxin family protein [Phycisphaerales bacterium]